MTETRVSVNVMRFVDRLGRGAATPEVDLEPEEPFALDYVELETLQDT